MDGPLDAVRGAPRAHLICTEVDGATAPPNGHGRGERAVLPLTKQGSAREAGNDDGLAQGHYSCVVDRWKRVGKGAAPPSA